MRLMTLGRTKKKPRYHQRVKMMCHLYVPNLIRFRLIYTVLGEKKSYHGFKIPDMKRWTFLSEYHSLNRFGETPKATCAFIFVGLISLVFLIT